MDQNQMSIKEDINGSHKDMHIYIYAYPKQFLPAVTAFNSHNVTLKIY